MTERQQAEYLLDVQEQAERALTAALFRALTEDEIATLRFAAGIPERRPGLSGMVVTEEDQNDHWEI